MTLTSGDPIAALSANLDAWIDTLEGLDRARAPLFARYGPGGTFEAERKVLLCTIRDEIRSAWQESGKKFTVDAVDDAAHADDRYMQFLEQALQERTTLAEQDAVRVALDHKIAVGRTSLYVQGKLAGVV